MDKQREIFEAWYSKHCEPGVGPWFVRDKDNSDEYYMSHMQTAWDAWQAAIAAQWQPIETAPKDGTIVDLWSKMHGRLSSYYRTDLGDGNVFYEPAESGYSVVRDATHWMPLPPEPTK